MIGRLGSRGDGIADTAAGALHVPYTLPGETAEVDPWPGHADRRHLIKVDIASPDRIAPICPHFGICGGCALQHLATARYRDWKRGLVTEALAQAGLDAPVDDLIDAHGEGRRRAVFHARRGEPRRARGRIRRAQGPSRGGHRPLSHPRAGSRRRDRDGLGHCRGARGSAQAARHPGHGDRRRPRRRRARLRAADGRFHG